MMLDITGATRIAALLVGVASVSIHAQDAPRTETLMLSGSGPDDAVRWQFRIDGGMRAGEETTIAVPSNWQQQGFGHYQYGYDRGPRSADRAIYRRSFVLPADWKDRTVRIMFDGAMTDTTVRINGVSAGPVHQGGFNRFDYDVTRLLRPGSNSVEVEVAEASTAKDTDTRARAFSSSARDWPTFRPRRSNFRAGGWASCRLFPPRGPRGIRPT